MKIAIRVLMLAMFLAAGTARADDLEKQFVSPPDSAKPWVYWFVMDGNFSREGITADLEAMKRVGIAGVLFMEVDVGIPKGPVKFMSPPWRELFKHANAEAARLGLVMTMPASPGWTGSGGPWVKPEQSMQKLVSSETEISGPQHFESVLPQPKAIAGFYRDVVVLAFPTPAEAYRISDIEEKALYQRGTYSSAWQAGVKALLPSPAEYAALPPEQVVPMDRIVDLTGKMDADGKLVWNVPQGKWTVLRFGHTSTGANTRPAPEPGLGLECDKLDKAALKAHFDEFMGKMMSDIGPLTGKSLIALHIDSWEMGSQNWTARFREEFTKRRGYDPLRYLPAMTGRVVDSLEASERFLWDLRQTVLDLITDNHSAYLAELAHQHGLKLSIEPYDGTPCDDMTYGSRADVPMGEFWTDCFETWHTCAEASSIAHTYGKTVVQAEAFTSGDAERWLAHPASLKALGDWAYCAGINRFVFHRYAHQPWLDRWPGMTMGPYGIHYDRTTTWFEQSKAWNEYLARCQFLLQQGLFVADYCYLMPEASPQVFYTPPSATRGNPPERLGYNFDALTPEAFLTRASVEPVRARLVPGGSTMALVQCTDGRLVLPGGTSYDLLVLPNRDTMTPALLRKIRELVEAGLTVVGPPPLKSPSLTNYPQCDKEVKRLAAELWGDCDGKTIKEHKLGKGRIVWERGPEPTDAMKGKDPLEQATWIWQGGGNPAAAAPAGKRYFRIIVNVDPERKIESAQVAMTADNSFELWVNGQSAGSGDNFHQISTLDVASLLKPGANVLAVAAENGGEEPNPAGLIGSLSIRFQDGSEIEVATGSKWRSAATVQENWMANPADGDGWSAAMQLGPLGMAPWGMIGKSVNLQPDMFCDYNVIAGLLAKMDIPPDFESDGPLRYIHRRADDTDIYFVANREDRQVDANCVFRVFAKTPELWDPLTGERRDLPEFTGRFGRVTIPMRFEPTQSFFVVFRKPDTGAKTPGRNFAKTEKVAELAGPWEVSFDPKWGGPEKVAFQTLDDWSKRTEDGIRYYSGAATYRKTLDMPQATDGQRLYLDLGVVKNLAQVKLNGRDLGVVWCAPWRVDVTGAVKAKDNRLEITVVNLWPNRLIGDQSLPEGKRLTWTTWNPFEKNTPLLESGLLGPVTLRKTDQGM